MLAIIQGTLMKLLKISWSRILTASQQVWVTLSKEYVTCECVYLV